MAVSVLYNSENKLILNGLDCTCACEHHQIHQDIYIGEDLLPKIPQYILQKKIGRSCVLVADSITWNVAGEKVMMYLTDAGFAVTPCVIRRDGKVLPDDEACGEVLLSITQETSFLLSVGSGSVTDTTRINAMRTGLPFVSVGTAPSMDGYASVVSPLLHRGVKIQRPAVCPCIIICDLGVMATAPMPMLAGGVGDVMGKYIALADWQISQIVTGETYCPLCGEIVKNAVQAVAENINEIARKTTNGIRALIEALVLAGVAGLIVGNTRPVASVEHAISQYWEMMMLGRGMEPPMHGASVGVATLMLMPIYERFAKEDLSKVDCTEAVNNRLSRKERENWLHFAFGPEGGDATMRTYPEDFLTDEEQARRIRNAQTGMKEISAILSGLPPKDCIEKILATVGGDLTPSDEQIPSDILTLSMWCGKDYRSRYSILKLLDELGLLHQYLGGSDMQKK